MKKILNHLRTDWYKYLLELIVITAGVLGAFALNNWNEEKGRTIAERKLIGNINQESINNLKNLETAKVKIDNLILSITSLMESMSEPTSNRYQGEPLDSLLARCSQVPPLWRRSDLNIRQIESTSQLGENNKEELKLILYNWLGILEDIKGVEESGYDSFLSYINYIKEHGSWREIDKYGGVVNGGSILMPDNDHLLTDFKFENVVDDYLVWLSHRRNIYSDTGRELQRIIDITTKD